jgi:hypothetical protein
MTEFRKELEALINRHSMENGSDTCDFMLADYLIYCLEAFEKITRRRDEWHGFKAWSNQHTITNPKGT